MNMSGCEGPASRCTVIGNAGTGFWGGAFKNAHKGTNAVRIPLNAVLWQAASYQASVAKAVADATASGLYVLLDLHWSAPPGQAVLGQPGFPDAANAIPFWKQVADDFKSNPAVIFELFNEPFGDNNYGNSESSANGVFKAGAEALFLASGGAFKPFCHQNNSGGNAMQCTSDVGKPWSNSNFTYQVAGELTLLDTIRGEGATNVVLASPFWWAGEPETWLQIYTANGNPDPLKQFGMSMHDYGYSHGTGPLLGVLAAGYPIVITEFSQGSNVSNLGGVAWTNSQNVGLIAWGPNCWAGPLTMNPTGW
jgi:hypothetical protein